MCLEDTVLRALTLDELVEFLKASVVLERTDASGFRLLSFLILHINEILLIGFLKHLMLLCLQGQLLLVFPELVVGLCELQGQCGVVTRELAIVQLNFLDFHSVGTQLRLKPLDLLRVLDHFVQHRAELLVIGNKIIILFC